MDISNNIIRLLEHMDRPGFLAKDGIIIYANHACSKLDIQPNQALAELIRCDYTPLSQGMQSLKLTLPSGEYAATVENLDGFDLFVLEHAAVTNELRVLALASKQLRGPLTTLMNSMEEADPSVSRSLHQLHRTISNMSDAYRYQVFRIPELVPTEISAFMNEIMEAVAAHLESLGIKISYQGMNRACFCLIDQELLKRCVLNLITNAVVAGGKRIYVSLCRTNTQLLLTVEDNGHSVSTRVQANMFHSFQRDPELTQDTGLGLGMQMVQAAAQAHNGTVLMEQPKSGGIRLTVTLSVIKAPPPVQAPKLKYDYLGGRDHILTELSDILPESMY